MITRYQKRLSGPLMDRIDIHIEVPRVDYEKLSDERFGESSADVQARVEAVRERQRDRFAELDAVACNADMGPGEVRVYCHLGADASSILRNAMKQMQLTARAYHRVLKLGRTIADLAAEDEISPAHLAEALQYRERSNLH